MRNTINQDDIDFFNQHGFVRIRGLLDREEVERLRTIQAQALEQRGAYRFPDRDIKGSDSPELERMFIQRMNLWRDYPPIREFTLAPNIAKIAAQLTGVAGMRLWHDSAFIKMPWANPTSWHFDAAYWSFSSAKGVTVWVALNDSDAANGGLYFMPGSHKRDCYEIPNFPEDRVAGLFDLPGYEHWKTVEPVCLPLKAGDCTFHSGMTIHGSGTNMTPFRREAWVCVFMPDGVTFNGKPNLLPVDYLEQLTVGDKLQNDEFNPLLYTQDAK